MATSFPDSFDQLAGDSTRSLDDDGYFGYDPRLASQQFDSFSNFSDSESFKQSALDDSSTAFTPAFNVSDGGFPADPAEFSSFAPEDGEGGFSGAILPPPAEMEPEDSVALKEWRRANLIRLAEKEKREKESLSQIIGEAEEYKFEFYKKRNVSCEANKGTNREKEKDKLYLEELKGPAASLEEDMAPANQPPVRERYMVEMNVDWSQHRHLFGDEYFEFGKKIAIQVMEQVCGSCRREDIKDYRVSSFVCYLSEDELKKMRGNAGVDCVVPDRHVLPEEEAIPGWFSYGFEDTDEDDDDS